ELQTARQRIAEQYAEKSEQFRAICDCSPVGIFVSDMAGGVTYFNRLLERMTGLSTQAASDSGWTDALHPDDRDRVVKQWEQAARECTQYQTWGRFLHSDDSTIDFEVVADPIERDGQLVGFVGAVEDVTARIAASMQLEDSNCQLREALQQLTQAQNKAIKQERLNALGQMAAGVAHDINNSLAPLLTYSELLEQDPQVQGQGRHWVEMIRLGVSDTAGIVKRLDHFYRESHNREFLRPINIAVVVHQAIELTRPKWQNFNRTEGKQIDVRLQDDVQPVVDGDATQIRAVLTNLIFNAVDAISGRGTVNVSVTETPGYAMITVEDDGCGMSADQLEHCLEPFFTSKSKGSGLGLSECHGIVRQHRGTLDVTSEPGRGTIVSIELPLSAHPYRDSIETERPAIALVDNNSTKFPESKESSQRVLYIDDDECVRSSTVSLLSALGVSVEAVSDGPAGLARLEQSEFSLVLCDQGMPDMDGIAVLGEIKKRWPDTPVVIISGWSLPNLHGAVPPDGFLVKPVPFADLVKVLEKFLPSINSA
ncbi:MAG: ATP-binding protein, partial [Pirellulaceae bacterium]